MRAKKKFIVVAYDIADDRRRYRVVKLLEKSGTRINYSVFECIVTENKFTKLQKSINRIMEPKEDIVVYYPICLDCYSKIVYQPQQKREYNKVFIV